MSSADPGIVERYLPLLSSRAQRFVGDAMSYEEAYAWGALGLVRAAKRYDCTREDASFARLAQRAIDASITDGLRKVMGRKIRKIASSLDAMEFWDAPSQDDTASEAVDACIRQQLAVHLEELDQESQLLLKLRYWHDKTYSQIAVALEITESAVAALHRRALVSLRAKLEETT